MAHVECKRIEWRVRDPDSKAYCIAFDFQNTTNPEREARDWLHEHLTKFPSSQFSGYKVAPVAVLDERDSLLLTAGLINNARRTK